MPVFSSVWQVGEWYCCARVIQLKNSKKSPRAEFPHGVTDDSQTGTEEGIAYFLFQRPLLCRLAGAQNPARFRSALRFPFQALMHLSATQFPVKMYGIAPFSCGYSRFLRLCGIFRSFKMQKLADFQSQIHISRNVAAAISVGAKYIYLPFIAFKYISVALRSAGLRIHL